MSKYDKLIDTTTKGLACLCFRNNDKLSIAEISDIFSEHGKVVSINCAGNDQGFRFVRFRTKEEALKCATALDTHRSIQLQPVRSKSNDSNENNHHNQFTKNKRENINDQRNDLIPHNAEQTDKVDSTKGSASFRKLKNNNYQRKNTDKQVQSGLTSINNLNNGRGETSKDQNPIGNRLNLRQFPRSNESDHKDNEIHSPNNRMNASKLEHLHRLRGTIANTFQVPGNDFATNVPAVTADLKPSQIISSPPSSHHSCRLSVMTDMPPPLVAGISSFHSGQTNGGDEKIEVVLACDVILANIHSNIGVSNIYQMLRKFSPIYVSDIETVPEINVRFCYAYFETPNDAMGVEQSFDGVSICGQNLITLRPQRLEVEAGIF